MARAIHEALHAAEQELGAGRPAAARGILEAAVAAMPRGWTPAVQRPDALEIAFWDQGEFLGYVAANGAQATRKIVWVTGSYSKAHYYLAFIAVEAGDLPGALGHIERALALEPTHPLLWSEKGLILNQMRRHLEATEAYERGAECCPWNVAGTARSLRGLGVALIDLRRWDEAEAALLKSLKLEPDSRVAMNELLVIQEQRGRASPGALPGEIVRTQGLGVEEPPRNEG